MGLAIQSFPLTLSCPQLFQISVCLKTQIFQRYVICTKVESGHNPTATSLELQTQAFRPLLAASLVKALILSNNFFANLDLLKAIGSRCNGSATSLVISIFSSKAKSRA